jgi:RNA polymerase sigma factor (sigma-70 family)
MTIDDLYREYRNNVFRVALLTCRNVETAEDVVQETFAKAVLQDRAGFPHEGAWRVWLMTTARNRAYNLERDRRKRGPEWLNEAAENVAPNRPPTTEEVLDEDALAVQLRAIFDKIPEVHREVMRLFYYEDVEIAEIAERLNLPIGTVQSRLGRGRNALRAIAAAHGLRAGPAFGGPAGENGAQSGA